MAGFLKDHADVTSPFALAKTHVWLPTNRGVLGLKESLIGDAKSSFIFPALYSLADIESKNPFLLKEIDALPEAISAFERLAVVMGFLPSMMHVKKAFSIAEYLITLHDECIISDVSVEQLESQYDATLYENAPAHVQDAFQNLRILTHYLPEELAKRGLVTESWRRQQAMRILANDLTQNPPDYPVLIAGTTGTVPATRMLLKAVYGLPNGAVVLPGLDGSADSKRVMSMRSHPQHTMFDLCAYLGVNPGTVPELSAGFDDFANNRRHAVMALFKEPPLDKREESTANPILIECASQAEEARVISAIVREKLFETNLSIAVVTPNQMLTRRLKSELCLHGITANDSAGAALKDTPVGGFMMNLVAFFQNPSCATFIHLAKHPLCVKSNRSDHLAYMRAYEIFLRKKQMSWDAGGDDFIDAFIGQLKSMLGRRSECRSFHDFVQFLKEVADALSSGTLFADNDGESAAAFFDALIKSPPFIRQDFEDAFLLLMSMAPSVHAEEGLGSRVRILGTLEARLNTADVVICASLNEGNWPKTPENDPILSDSFRIKVGLPSQRRRQGLAAHDFCTSFYASSLYMTRSMRESGEAMLQSRLWTRMQAVYGASDSLYLAVANDQIASAAVPTQPPMPMPLKAHRPTIYYASHVEQLMRDPYAYYMRHVLKLDPLPMLDEVLSAKDKGKIFHDILDKYIKTERECSLEALLNFSKPFFANVAEKGGGIVQTFWWHRFKRIAEWWHEKLDSEPANARATEVAGEITFMLEGAEVSLKSRADRIDVPAADISLRIIDYKTGSLPTRKSVADGSASQLLIEAVIAGKYGFGNAFPEEGVFQLEYWRLTGGDPAGECLTFQMSFADRLRAESSIKGVLTHYLREESPYVAVGSFADIRFLARMEEWEMLLV